MVKLRWIKSFEGSVVGNEFEAGNKSAENFISQGYAEYIFQSSQSSNKKSETINKKSTKNVSKSESETIHVSNVSKTKKSNLKHENSKKQVSIGNECKNNNKVNIDDNITSISTGEKIPNSESMFHVSNVSNVSNVSKSESETSETNETLKHILNKALGNGNLDLILKLLYKSNINYSTDDIGININKSKDIARTTISRNKNYFQEVDKVGGKKLFSLSDFGNQYCKKNIDNFTKESEKMKKQINEENKAQEESEKLKEEINKSLDELKPTIEGKIITIDFKELLLYNQDLADKLLDNPLEAIEDIKSHYSEIEISDVRFINLPSTQKRTAEGIRCKDIDKLLTVEGRCVSLSSVRPVITNAKFECPSCGTIISVVQIEKKFKEPSRCSCGRRGGFKIIAKDLQDSSNVVVEDLQDNTENPNTQRISARIQNFLVEKENIGIFNLGDEVKITGILRTVDSFDRGAVTINLGYLFEILDAEKKEEEILVDNFTDEDLQKIKDMAEIVNKEGMCDICNSFAPDVHGYEYIKNAIMLQACSKRNEPKQSSTRNKPNILLIGDPGIAKSVLCKFAMAITPGSRKAAGGGSSAVGITASVVKEEESMGGYRIEAGALPLAKELLFLDEMNNLTDDDKPKLQEAMSEQMISINKANLHVNLKVTAGVLATANPEKGNFIEGIPYNKQFNIPSPILNRFDEVFIMKDIPNIKRDEAIADIMIKRKKGEIKPKYSIDDLKRFFAYVRNTEEPEVTDEIADRLKGIYSDSRKNRNTDVIINPRFMEALSRMIEASAKMRLSEKVEEKDIERSLGILSQSHFKANEYKNFELGDKE